jgi:hypothetical protein
MLQLKVVMKELLPQNCSEHECYKNYSNTPVWNQMQGAQSVLHILVAVTAIMATSTLLTVMFL